MMEFSYTEPEISTDLSPELNDPNKRLYKIKWINPKKLLIEGLEHFKNEMGFYVDGALALLMYKNDILSHTFLLYYSKRIINPENDYVHMEFKPVYDDDGKHIAISDENLYEVPFLFGSNRFDREISQMTCTLQFYY